MIKRTYIELTADEIDILEKAQDIISEIRAGTDRTLVIGDCDEELINNIAELGKYITANKNAFYTIY